MEKVIVATTEYSEMVLPDIPNEDIWVSKPELVELFGVIASTLRAAVRAVYRSGVLKEYEVQKYVCLEDGYYADVLGFPMIAALAFHINGLGAEQVRKTIFERLYLQKEETSIFLSLVSSNMDSFNHQT